MCTKEKRAAMTAIAAQVCTPRNQPDLPTMGEMVQ
jgi:hypothetical protein